MKYPMKYPKGHIIGGPYPPDLIEIKETTLLSEDEINDIISKIYIRIYSGEFTYRAIYLPTICDYMLVEDDTGTVILVPTKKEKVYNKEGKMKYPKGHIIRGPYPPDLIEIKETTLLSEDEIKDIISKIDVRIYSGEFTHRAIYLPTICDYMLVEDDTGTVILVPTKTEKV